jgi:hypothetical protein
MTNLTEVLEFLNSIEGDGYGGMASFEIARMAVKDAIERGKPSCVHVPIIGLDGKWHCQKCNGAIEMATSHAR